MAKHPHYETFEEWMNGVNFWLNDICAMCADDLPDWDYRNAYDNGVSAFDAATSVVNNAADY